MRPLRNYQLADYQYEVIMEQIKEFEEELDENQELAIKLASFGQTILMSVTDIGYCNPNTIVFYGTIEGQNATLLQHMSMLNFLLLSTPKAEPDKPAKRIATGFQPPSDDV